jgi:hypothetical protein
MTGMLKIWHLYVTIVKSYGWLVGAGPGAGTALVFVFAGASVTLLSLAAYAMPTIKQVEKLLPDHHGHRSGRRGLEHE